MYVVDFKSRVSEKDVGAMMGEEGDEGGNLKVRHLEGTAMAMVAKWKMVSGVCVYSLFLC